MAMKRRDFLAGALVGLAGAAPAFAQDFVGSIIGQLKQQGFQSVEQERTLLGRVRITASRQDGRREIIVNPQSGEILRDLWTPKAGSISTVDIIKDKSGKGGTDDKDDEKDDDEDDGEGGGGGGGDDEGGDEGDDNDEGGDSSGSGGDDDNDDDDNDND